MALTEKQIREVMATDRAHLLYPDALRHKGWIDERAPFVDIEWNESINEFCFRVIANGYIQYPDTGSLRLKKQYTISLETQIDPSIVHDIPKGDHDFIRYHFSVNSLYDRFEVLTLADFKKLSELVSDDVKKSNLAMMGELPLPDYYSSYTFDSKWVEK